MPDVRVAGRNYLYTLGLGDTTDRYSMTSLAGDWLAVTIGADSGAGIKSDGTLWTWGNNNLYQLGHGDTTTRTVPTQVGSATDWAAVSMGTSHLLALKTDGTLWAVGAGTQGQLGNGSNPSYITALTQVGSATTWAKIHAIGSSSYAIKTDGTLWCWGQNDTYGILGIGSTAANVNVPTQEATASTLWVSIARSNASYTSHCIAVRSDGTLWGWGRSNAYQLGNGDTTTRTSPTQVGTATDWIAAAAGLNTTYAQKSDGTLWGVGESNFYQFGDNSTTTRTALAAIGSDTDWLTFVAGPYSLMAIKDTGEVHVCGYNSFGQLGTGNTTTVATLSAISPSITPTVVLAGQNAYILFEGEPPAGPEEGDIEVPVVIEVQNAGTISAPITIAVTSSGDISAPIWINVYDPDIFGETLAPTSTPEGDPVPAFSALVTLGGADVSANLIGRIEVDAEESAARIATFTLALSGEIDPSDWVGAAVTVDYKIGDTTWRLFTGSVDLPQIDIQAGTVLMRCTDGLQRIIDRSDKEQIDTLSSGATHSRIVFGTRNRGWRYITERLRTLAGHIDLSPLGAIRKTLWAIGTSKKTFTDDDVLDESVSLSLAPAASLVREVKATFQARTPRLRTATMATSWAPDTAIDYYPAIQTIRDAFDNLSNGWLAKTVQISGNSVTGLATSCTGLLIRRWVQDETREYTFTVRAGVLGTGKTETLSNSLTARYDEAAWVDEGRTVLVDPPLSGSTPENEIEDGINALRALARRSILASHRANSVEFSIPLDPTIDIIHTYTLDAQRITATGKCRRVQHVIDLDAGEATSIIVLALSAKTFSGTGGTDSGSNYAMTSPAVLPTVLPAPLAQTQIEVWTDPGDTTEPDWEQDGWACLVHRRLVETTQTPLTIMDLDYGKIRDISGKVINYRTDATYEYDIVRGQFRVSAPALPESYTEAVETKQTDSYQITVPEDPLTITI